MEVWIDSFGVVLDPVPKLFNRALVEDRIVDGSTIVEFLESVAFPVGRGFDPRAAYAQDNASSPQPYSLASRKRTRRVFTALGGRVSKNSLITPS